MSGVSHPDVSVVLPVRNAAAHLPATLDRLARTAHVSEVIIIDDSSNDDSLSIAQAAARQDHRIRVIALAGRRGVTAARWAGVEQAKARWVWFVDADDQWDTHILEVLVESASRTRAQIVACRAERVESSGRRWVMEGVDAEQTLSHDQFASAVCDGLVRGYLWNKLIDRRIITTGGRVPLSSQDDFLMVLDMLTRASRMTLVPDILYRYLDHPRSISRTRPEQLSNTATCHEEFLRRLPELGRPPRQAALKAFACWFWLVPVMTTPAHQGWAEEVPAAECTARRSALTWLRILSCLRQRPRTGIQAVAIKLSGRHYTRIYRAIARQAGWGIS